MIPNPADGFCAERVSTGSARRRRERRLRSWLRHDEDTEGARPDRLAGVRPQERDQRHTVEQIVDTVLFVPSLDVPVPQMENQLVDVCRLFDVLIPEQVIEVPKISSTPRPPRRRRVRFAEQTTEQLVEVPTIISYSSLQRTVEQNVNIPVPSRGGLHVGLQGFLPRQRSTALHASQERSSERIVEQIVDSRVLGGGSSASSSSSREHAGEGVFRTFPRVKKKVRSWARTRGRNCSPSRAHPPRQLMWTPGSMATTSGSASTPCMGRFGRSYCRTTCSGTRRGNATDGSTTASGWWLWWVPSL